MWEHRRELLGRLPLIRIASLLVVALVQLWTLRTLARDKAADEWRAERDRVSELESAREAAHQKAMTDHAQAQWALSVSTQSIQQRGNNLLDAQLGAVQEVRDATSEVRDQVEALKKATDEAQILAIRVAVGTALVGALLGGFAGAFAARLIGTGDDPPSYSVCQQVDAPTLILPDGVACPSSSPSSTAPSVTPSVTPSPRQQVRPSTTRSARPAR